MTILLILQAMLLAVVIALMVYSFRRDRDLLNKAWKETEEAEKRLNEEYERLGWSNLKRH